jgi:hypothetical protein
MANIIATAYTTDGVKVISEDNGAIGDRMGEFTRIRLSAEAQALVMAHVPHVAYARMAEIIRKANKGKLGPTPEQAAAIMRSNEIRRCEAAVITNIYDRRVVLARG